MPRVSREVRQVGGARHEARQTRGGAELVPDHAGGGAAPRVPGPADGEVLAPPPRLQQLGAPHGGEEGALHTEVE